MRSIHKLGSICLALSFAACARAGFDERRVAASDGRIFDAAEGDVAAPPLDVLPSDTLRTTTSGRSSSLAWTGVVLQGLVARPAGVRLREHSGFAVKKAALPVACAWAAAAARGDEIYLFGGGVNSTDKKQSAQILAYHPADDALVKVAVLPSPMSQTVAITAADDKIYLVKGHNPNFTLENRVMRFDPITKLTTPSKASLLKAYRHAATLGSDGLIYVLGGSGSGPIVDGIQAYDPKGDTVKTLPTSLKQVGGREKVQGVQIKNKIYLVGGALDSGKPPTQSARPTDEILEYDRGAGSVAVVAKLPRPLINVMLALSAERSVLIIGGDAPLTGSRLSTEPLSTVYRFDPKARRVVLASYHLPFPLSGAASATAKNGKLYLFGGRLSSGLSAEILELSPYFSSGTLLGMVIDAGHAGALWTSLAWDGDSPKRSTIAVFARASDAPFRQDAAAPLWRRVSGPSPATKNLPSGRYLQWKIDLLTDNTAITPVVREVKASYFAG